MEDLDPALSAALVKLEECLRVTSDPWWVLGSAALALSGADAGKIRDVDVLVSRVDADRLMQTHAWSNQADGGTDRYRSQIFLTPELGAVPVEIMADYEIFRDGEWSPVLPQSRQSVWLGETKIFVPDFNEQIDLLKALGRPKDLERLAQLKWSQS